jgi:transposase
VAHFLSLCRWQPLATEALGKGFRVLRLRKAEHHEAVITAEQGGRPSKLNAHQLAEVRARRANGHTLTDIGRSFNVSYMTIARALG